MEDHNWACSSDDDVGFFDDPNDDENCYPAGDMPKLQSRFVISKARWRGDLGMAEVVEKKGKLWVTTGITRNGKLFCTMEETLYLVEIGALQVSDDDDAPLVLRDVYKKTSQARNGNLEWDSFEVYKNLKGLGYIVGRHGIPWSMKAVKVDPINIHETSLLGNRVNDDPGDSKLITEMLNDLQIKATRPIFDVYSPNSKFKKSSPGSPCFMVYLSGGYPSSAKEINELEDYCGGIPFRICKVEHGRVSFFCWRKVELPVLP